ncbi:integral membrane channel protein, putative [Talaromyces stipitatus ATCC 10500]|uniref:Integral membrane channel protein, putative n=1 Tax=Talaromyces stipitatus (strain ATCC 10500 / CBS 375.48 / QM 6759 / NRRL 1006) TaxID=441959 RepID=B8MER5_TALSN|nr:integral membrane channel protein, putative [Talaromyces stipitatus ATCC 10500]EED16948.1 integral membrane channel protein, putative [Talaromyces stipitatus ATCC 10500]
MLASLLRPRKPRQHVLRSASPHETTPFFRRFLRDDGSLAPTEPDDYLNEHGQPAYEGEETEPRDDDSDEGHLLPIFSSPHLDLIPVYTITHSIRYLIISRCETSLTWEQLRSPQISQFLLKPIQQQVREFHFNRSTLYALMANCLQFNKEADLNPGNSGTSRTRAHVSELLAIKILKEYTTRELIDALSYDFYPLQGQTPISAENLRASTWNQGQNATGATRISCLEIAIRAQAKRFIAHPLVVQHLEAIWAGTIVFHSAADNLHRLNVAAASSYGVSRYGPTNESSTQYGKRRQAPQSEEHPRRAVTLYDPRDASLFKLSRLRVPRYRHFLSTLSFAVLLSLYLAVLIERSLHITTVEVVFWLWAAGFMLDEIVGFNEQGFSLYLMSFWNLFDLGILLLLFCYSILRLYVMGLPDVRQRAAANQAYDILSAGAVLLFPRLFSVLDHYKYFSQLLIAFRIMAADLMAVFLLIVVACSGFLVAFSFSSASSQSPQEVIYALFQILMGFTPTAWSLWEEYDALGRFILTIFLFICHFVVVTILITVLTNSFMSIVKNAHEEHQFLFAINTISMVKSDALFSYVAPSNILGWMLTPLRYLIPLREFVKLNRTMIKFTHFPILWSICLYEKMILSSSIIDPTELIEGNSRLSGRSTAVLRARNDRQSRFETFHRLTREPSIATYQQDRVLEELFRRPFRQQSMQDVNESPDGRRKSAMVANWMQGMSTIEEQTPRPPSTLRRMVSPQHRNYTETSRSFVASDPEEFTNYGGLHPVPEHPTVNNTQPRLGRHASHTTDVEGDDEKSSDENHDDESDEDRGDSISDSQNASQTARPSSKSTPKFFSSRPSTAVYNSRKNSPTRHRPASSHLHTRNISSVTILHNHPGDADDSTDDAMPGPSSAASPLKGLETERPALPQRTSFMPVPNFNRIGSDMGNVGALPSSLATQIATDNDVLGRLVLARMQNIEAGFREVLKEVKDLRGKLVRESRHSGRKSGGDDLN